MIGLAMILALAGVDDPPNPSTPFLTAGWFVENCQNPKWTSACQAYIQGVYDDGTAGQPANAICVPPEQMYDVAMAYMRERPGYNWGVLLISESWEAAFPCPKT